MQTGPKYSHTPIIDNFMKCATRIAVTTIYFRGPVLCTNGVNARGFWKITPAPTLKATSKRQRTRYKFGGGAYMYSLGKTLDQVHKRLALGGLTI